MSVHLLPGQFIFGRKTAAKELKWTESTLYKRLQKLKTLGNCNIESNTHYSVVTICKWTIYNPPEIQKEQAKEQAGNTQGTPKEHKQEGKEGKESKEQHGDEKTSPCPHQEIIKLYNKNLPTLPQVIPKFWNGARANSLQARWREDKERQSIEWWGNLFIDISKMPFLMGEVKGKDFKADLGWILKPANFVKIIEGKYKIKVQEEDW